MITKDLPLTGDYALDVLSYYIWGEKNRPSDITDEKYANRNLDKKLDITLNVSTHEFMSRYFQINTPNDFKQYVAKIPMFELFFNNKHRFDDNINLNDFLKKHPSKVENGKLVLDHSDFVELFYGTVIDSTTDKKIIKNNQIINSANNPNISFSMYRQDPDKVEDFAQAAFVFGSSNFTFDYVLDDKGKKQFSPKYIFNINEDGSITPSHIENLKFTLNTDNFDFESDSPLAKMINPTLQKITDPNDIGKKVKINFINDFYPNDKDINLTLTAKEFSNLKTTTKNLTDNQILSMWEKFAKAYFDYFEKIAKSNIIDYSSNGKYLIYGNKNDNTINGTITKSGVDLKDAITIKDNLSILEKAVSYFWESMEILGIAQGISITKDDLIKKGKKLDLLSKLDHNLNPHKNKLNNGITYIGGKGSDTIIGTEFDDILYSNDKSLKDDNSSDILKGGKGYDTYYANDKDIITDSDGKGKVYFNNTQLIGGILDKDKSSNSIKVYLSEDKNIEYHLDENSKVLKVIDKNNNNAELTINNFNKEEKSLNINLADNLGKEVAIVIDTTGSMWDDIETTKSKALTIAKNIFRENSSKDLAQSNTFSKISIVTFSDNNIKTIGTYYNYNSFQSGINSVNIENGGTEYHCAAMIEGMSNFTKDNGLDKQIFLMTDEGGDDNHRMDEVIAMANNFGKEMTTFTRMMSSFTNSSKIIYDNSVKINVISINSNLSHLKRLSDETGGLFLQPNSLNELEDALFDASNLGTNKSETIIGNNKNNIIEGKGGDDILQGKEGSDTYIFKDKFDKDIIIETNKNNIDKNKIDLSSFSIKDAKFKVDNNDLTITIIDTKKDSFITALDKISHNITKFLDLNFTEFKDINIKDSIKGSITIKEFFNKDEFKISTIKFSDYTIDETTLNSLSKNRVDNIEILNNSFINPFKSNLIISNEDIVKATLKDDIVVANKDNQTIISNLGNDTLITNKNNNTLIGENGDDTYIIGKDANNTIIRDKEYVNLIDGGNDTLILNDIDKSSVEFKLGGSFNKDLIINYSNSNSKDIKTLTIQNQTNKYSAIENINLDGTMLGTETINKIIQDLNSYGNDNGISLNFNSEFNNNDIMQIYNS
ncbi:hypothetical protein CE91St25_17130 [Campylobacter ureolyticus]|uniref:VWA domain-containing protein n=3 Tax=Campylobacter ureolyticus TaxID=827 RepID=UPI001FC8D0CC|nr:VWA domain-containing protein [Campylobacter ureolyticus]GKH61377.1 hypothetical protein CE91St25_17130 [Campylobacter ureolyticus]